MARIRIVPCKLTDEGAFKHGCDSGVFRAASYEVNPNYPFNKAIQFCPQHSKDSAVMAVLNCTECVKLGGRGVTK